MNDISGVAFLVIEWILVFLCIVVVALRLSVRVWKKATSFWLSDTLLVIAVLMFITMAVGDIIDTCNLDPDLANFSSLLYSEWNFVVYLFFYFEPYFPRFSLLAFFYELFPVSEHRARISLYYVIAYTSACALSAVFIVFFWCGTNVPQNWLPRTDPNTCVIWDSQEVVYINWAVGFSSEVLIFLLPFQLYHLLGSLGKREKIGLMIIFLLGIITILTAVTRIVSEVYLQGMYIDWTIESAEIATQIIIVALPALRPFLSVVKNRTRTLLSRTGQTQAGLQSQNEGGSQKEDGSHKDSLTLVSTNV